MRSFSRAAAIAMLLATSALAGAHHSIGMIEISQPIWLKATVVSYEPRNPHVLIHVDEPLPNGGSHRVTLEGPILSRLERMHLAKDFLKPGDAIEVCGFPYRKDIVAGTPADVPPLPELHVMLIVLPDGRRQPWGPYGKLDNCVRPGDTAQQWVNLVNADPMMTEYWCKGLRYPRAATAAAKALVEEVSRRMAAPCG